MSNTTMGYLVVFSNNDGDVHVFFTDKTLAEKDCAERILSCSDFYERLYEESGDTARKQLEELFALYKEKRYEGVIRTFQKTVRNWDNFNTYTYIDDECFIGSNDPDFDDETFQRMLREVEYSDDE